MSRFIIRIVRTVIVSLIALNAAPGLAEESSGVGIRLLQQPVVHRGAPVAIALWYPSRDDRAAEPIGGNALFTGTPAMVDATPLLGPYPLVLLAHGGLRAAPHLGSWLARELAARGWIVVSVQPPRLTGDDARRAVDEPWLRPLDLLAGLRAARRDPVLGPRLDRRRTASVGFFLAGTATLMLTGARLDPAEYRRACQISTPSLDCLWYAQQGVNLAAVPLLMEANPPVLPELPTEPPVQAAVAIHPELAGSFSDASLADIGVPVTIIELGKSEVPATGPEIATLATAIPGADHMTLPASPYSAFPSCTERAPAILRAEGESDALCRDSAAMDRVHVHRQLLEQVVDALVDRL